MEIVKNLRLAATTSWQVGPGLATAAADEIERLQEAKRRTAAIADERSKENVGLRAEIERLRAALAYAYDGLLNHHLFDQEQQDEHTNVIGCFLSREVRDRIAFGPDDEPKPTMIGDHEQRVK